MDFSTRLKGALSLLLGRGDNGTVCSFCASNRHAVETIIAGPVATSICNRCVMLCNEILLENSDMGQFRRHAEKPHEQTFGLVLHHEEALLGEPERIALDPMLRRLVATLPETRLVGWAFSHAEGRFDMLTISVVTTSTISHHEIEEMAVANWKGMRDRFLSARQMPANLQEPELITIAAAARQAADTYAEAVASSEPTAS